MVEFGTSSSFRGWVRVLGYGFGVRGRKVLPDVAWPAARSAALWAFCQRQNAPEANIFWSQHETRKVKSRDCALASDLVRAGVSGDINNRSRSIGARKFVSKTARANLWRRLGVTEKEGRGHP